MSATRPFVDRPVADRDAASAAARRQAREWGLRGPILLRHGMNSLYECGDVVVRVGAATAPAALSHELARRLLAAGVPTITPIEGMAIDIEGLAVTAWERVEPATAAIDWAEIGRAVKIVHSLPRAEVPAGYPLPDPANFAWWDFDSMLADVAGELDGDALVGLRACLDRNGGWQEQTAGGAVLCHGDVHPGNVLASERGPLLIDWDLMCVANPAWDHAMLTTYADCWGGDPAVRAAFLAGYGEPGVDDELARSLGELRNVAATLMRVRAGRDDPAAAAEAEHRLRYWRGEPDAAPWHAQ